MSRQAGPESQRKKAEGGTLENKRCLKFSTEYVWLGLAKRVERVELPGKTQF